MSLSDEIKLLRALHGGVTPLEIQAATGVPCATIGEIETKYRRVGDDDAVLATLAAYFGQPLAAFQRHREWYRKKLTAFLAEARAEDQTVCLHLRGGEVFVGHVLVADKTVVSLRTLDGEEVVILRHAVDHWELAETPAGRAATPDS